MANDARFSSGHLLAPGDQPRTGAADRDLAPSALDQVRRRAGQRRARRRGSSSDSGVGGAPGRPATRCPAAPGWEQVAVGVTGCGQAWSCHRPGDPVEDVVRRDDERLAARPGRSTQRRISAPAPITSARPGSMNGSARRSATVIARTGRSPARTSSRRQPRQVDPLPVVAVEARAPSLPTRHDAPGHADERPRRTTPAARRVSSAASTSATAAAISSAVGGSLCRCRSVSRTEPTSSDTARTRLVVPLAA